MINKLANNPYLGLQGQNPKASESLKIAKKNSVSFSGLIPTAGSKKMEIFYQNKNLHKVLKFASDHELLFGASFALLLTCILRPASIMVAPSKKNKEDQKYAAAHSVASGVIGFGIATILFLPLENAVKKFKQAPKAFIKNKDSYLLKEENTICLEAAKTYLGRFGDLVGSIPKGILTIALIPPILKHVFGWERKKPPIKEEMSPSVASSSLNFKSAENINKNVFQNFNGGAR